MGTSGMSGEISTRIGAHYMYVPNTAADQLTVADELYYDLPTAF